MKIGVIGCFGRMGQAIIEEVKVKSGIEIAAGLVEPGSPEILKTIIGDIKATDNIDEVLSVSDAVIDFTSPGASVLLSKKAAEHGVAHIIGTTGCTKEQIEMIKESAKATCIIMAPNMSLGVNLLIALTERVASILDNDFDAEILEMHHRHKKDSPSGTGLALGEAVAKGREVTLSEKGVFERHGNQTVRKRGEIGFAVMRGGDVAGDHSVIFAGEGERIELTHKAGNRSIFAKGAVRAALWSQNKQPGFYSMRDVLGI